MMSSGLVLIEARTEKLTLRFRLTGADVYLVEKWNEKDQSWDTSFAHTDYDLVLHEYLDELCRLSEASRRRKENSDGGSPG